MISKVTIALCLLVSTASAKPRVAVIASDPGDGTVRRLRAELTALGWDAVAVPLSERRPDVIGLHALMTNQKAGAAIALLPAPKGDSCDVWILDEVGMVVSRERFARDEANDLVALRTVERLRASRIAGSVKQPQRSRKPRAVEVGPPPPQRRDIERPSSSQRAGCWSLRSGARRPCKPSLHARPVELELSHLQVSGGLALGWAPGGFSPTGQVRLGVSWTHRPWLSTDLILLAPLVSARASKDAGHADAYLALAGLAMRLSGGSPSSRFRPSIAVGVGGLLVHMRGSEAGDNRVSTEDTVGVAMPFVDGSVKVRLTRTLRLNLSYLMGATTQRVVAMYVGSLDHLLISGCVGLELEVP